MMTYDDILVTLKLTRCTEKVKFLKTLKIGKEATSDVSRAWGNPGH